MHGANCRHHTGKGDRMAEFKTVIKNFKRICESYKVCEGCPLTKDGSLCSRFMIEYPEEAEHTIMQWAAEHPMITNRDKFKEVFGLDYLDPLPGGGSAWLTAEYKGGQDNGTD